MSYEKLLNHPILDNDTIVALINAYREHGNIHARDRVILYNIKTMYKYCIKLGRYNNIDPSELMSDAIEICQYCIENYDKSRGKFNTYLNLRLNLSLSQAKTLNPSVGPTQNAKTHIRLIRKWHDAGMSISELAKRVNASEKYIKNVLNRETVTVEALEKYVDDEEDGIEWLGEDDKAFRIIDIKYDLEVMFKCLSRQQKFVMRSLANGVTVSEIANVLGCVRQNVYRIKMEAIEKIRKHFDADDV